MGRMAPAVVGSWLVLTVPYLAPGPLLPQADLPVVYSHGAMGLWFIGMPVLPVVVCVAKRQWIRTGQWSKPLW